ncbi:MAG: serine protease [Myxococcota bacterium]
MLFLVGLAAAFPYRAPIHRSLDLTPGPGRSERILIVKLAEGQSLTGDLAALLDGATPLFTRPAEVLQADRRAFDPDGTLADLSLYLRIVTPDPATLGHRLQADARIETAYLAFQAMPPPVDLSPTTPDFTDLQTYAGPAPVGFGFDEAGRWPGGDGANVSIADIEYGWDSEHEDLDHLTPGVAWGWDSGNYAYHGTAVLGQLAGGDNGYGVTGMAPEADVFVVSPYTDAGDYSVAAALDGAASLLDAGDVILIEQQAYAFGNYVPVSADPAVFDAIAAAVAKGIVVVEAGGNGGQDLDDPQWEGWFDRSIRDSGAIMVGGGASPYSGMTPRAWYTWGSSYGSRIDVQGWYDSIVTTNDSTMADLFLPGNDDRQGYTSYFGGTSGASPMVAAAAAVANSVAWELWGTPWDPYDLRAALSATGTPQPASDAYTIGPQPDLRRFLMTYGVR